jgi:hypothetical protein
LLFGKRGGTKGGMSMELRDYITIAVGCVTTVAVLATGYLHRKQMRQIEAYRVNPTVGLIPPPNPVWAFIKRYARTAIVVWTVLALFLETFSDRPIDRKNIFFIAFDFSALVVFFVLWIVDRVYDVVLRQAEIQGLMSESMKTLVGSMNTLVEGIGQGVSLLKPPEKPKQPE